MIARKKPQQLPDRFLAALLFLMAIEMIIYLVRELIYHLTGYVFTTDLVPFTYGPILLLYTQSMIQENFRFRWYYWLHFIPFLAFLIFFPVLADKSVIPVDLSQFLGTDRYQAHRIVFSVLFFLSIMIYGIIIFILIGRHQRNIRHIFSYRSEKITLQWLKILSITFYVAYNIVFITAMLEVFDLFSFIDPLTFSFAGLTFMAFAFNYYGLKQPAIFNHTSTASDPAPEPEAGRTAPEHPPSIYERSGLSEADIADIRRKIEVYFQEQQPYLQNDLTLQDIAWGMDLPRHHLTQVFTMGIWKNFYQYVNEYRLEEVKRRLVDPEYTRYSMIAIAFDAGFNSKTSFNTLFKGSTGLTPSEYQKKHLKLPLLFCLISF